MVATQFNNNSDADRFWVRRNGSLSWRNAVRFYTAMVVAIYGIAFTTQDAWLILPLVGPGILVPGIALYVVVRRNASWQAISISEDLVEVFEQRLSREHQCFWRACSIVAGYRHLLWMSLKRLVPAREPGLVTRLRTELIGRTPYWVCGSKDKITY